MRQLENESIITFHTQVCELKVKMWQINANEIEFLINQFW